ncbi:MAG: choline kinase family protein, partial [Chloroflexi bacterium]|nr:choline kinase family protein [Chloroflexota bacterium]
MNEIIRQIQKRMPAWQGRKLTAEVLTGGITNQNYKVTVDNEVFAVRICAPNVGIHGINRQVEYQCAKAAAQIGIAPEVVAFLEDLPSGNEVLITRFIDAQPLTSLDSHDPVRLNQIVTILQRYHSLSNFGGQFDVFRIFENCLVFAFAKQAPLPPSIDEVQAAMKRIERALQRLALPPTPCHNDLLPNNFLLDKTERLWLIDWEYAGWGDPFFDLGNLAVNHEFDNAQDEALLTAYFGGVTALNLAHLKLMKIVSDAREGIWSFVQWSISTLEFDYAAYGNVHLERFMKNYASVEVADWLTIIENATPPAP